MQQQAMLANTQAQAQAGQQTQQAITEREREKTQLQRQCGFAENGNEGRYKEGTK